MYGASKQGSPARILSKILLICTMLLAGCASNPQSATSPFFPAESSGEYGDDISYWDGARSAGKPRIIIDLEQQRAYFYKGGEVVGVSVVSTGREGYDTPSGEFRVTQKDLTHVSSIYGDYVGRSGQVVVENVNVTEDPRPPGTVFRGAPMPYFLRIQGGSACTQAICPAIRHHTAVSACPKKWRFIFSKMLPSVPLWSSTRSQRPITRPMHRSAIRTSRRLR